MKRSIELTTQSVSADKFVELLAQKFSSMADAQRAPAMSAYMRGIAPFVGIASPQRVAAVRSVLSAAGRPDSLEHCAELLYACPEREFHYAAWDVCSQRAVIRTLNASDIQWLERFIGKRSWWDTIDYVVPRVIGMILRSNPELVRPVTAQWISSENYWYQRAAIIVQLGWKKETQFDVLSENILLRASSKEFFVRKGAGWALRDYSYTAPDVVSAFVEKNKAILSPLTVREALKRIAKTNHT